MEDGFIDLSNHKIFFCIATRSLTKAKDETNRMDLRAKRAPFTQADIDFIVEKNAEIRRYAASAVLFSVMTLESYVNGYALDRFSRSYFDKYLDKLDLKSKWVVYPKLVSGNDMDTGSKAFASFTKLIALRNRLVHDKPRKKRLSELNNQNFGLNYTDAQQAVDTVRGMVNELAALDTAIRTDWLDKVELSPFI